MTESGAARTPGRFRRPSLRLAASALILFGILVGLGFWQLQRLHAKTALVERIAAGLESAPIALPDDLAVADVATAGALEYRRVRVAGRFLHDAEMYRPIPSRDGRAGYRVMTPLVRPVGLPVLVSRGWVPPDRRDPAARAAGQVAGPITVEGVARVPRAAGWPTPRNDPEQNLWYAVDPAAMAAHAGLDAVLPVYVEAGPAANPGGLPVGGQTRVNISNRHLEYVVTWWGLAAALAGVFVAYHWRRPTEPTA